MSSPYSIAKHTILPLVFKISMKNRFCTLFKELIFLLNQPQTKSLIMINPYVNDAKNTQVYSQIQIHIENIQKMTGSVLKYTFSNHQTSQLSNVSQLKAVQHNNPTNVKDLAPKVIGDLSFCFIASPGYLKVYSLIAVTHMTSSSTKIPVLFPGKLMGVSSINYDHQCQHSEYMKSLQRVKYFPNQTYIFPEKKVQKADLSFAQAILKDSSEFIGVKLNLFKQHQQKEDKLIPTTVLQEKMMNPFVNVSKSLKNLNLGQKNLSIDKGFGLLKKLRKQWKHPQ